MMPAQGKPTGTGRSRHAKWLLTIMLSLAVLGCHDDKDASIPSNVPTPLMNTAGSVSVAGDTIVGSTLTASVSDFNGTGGNIGYQWSAGGTAIAGATAASYVLTNAEVGSTITVTASYTDGDGFAETVTSAATAVVTIPANVAGTVAIMGVPTVGETLTAMVSDGNGTTVNAIAYQWQADGANITGATAQTFVLTAAEVNAMITVNVVYTDDDGYAEDTTSAAIGPVNTTATNVAGTIEITGTTLVGETLTAVVTDANGATTVNYQWQADSVDIAGATQDTFALTSAERGAVVSVTANYTDDDGFAEGPVSDDADDIVYSAIVTGEAGLLAAAAAVVDGDVIGLDSASGGDDYANMAEVDFGSNMLTIKRTANSTAVITGSTCLVFSGDDIVADGLVFDMLDWLGGGTCDSNGDASVYLSGDRVTLRNSSFLGEAFPERYLHPIPTITLR